MFQHFRAILILAFTNRLHKTQRYILITINITTMTTIAYILFCIPCVLLSINGISE